MTAAEREAIIHFLRRVVPRGDEAEELARLIDGLAEES